MKKILGKKRTRTYSSISPQNIYQFEKRNNINISELKRNLNQIQNNKYFIKKLIDKSTKKEKNNIFLKRKKEAIEIINELKDKFKKSPKDVKDSINKSYLLDNTNKTLIYESIKIMSNLNMINECNKYLNDVKYSITKKFYTYNNGKKIQVDLSKIVSLKDVYLFEDDKDILTHYINSMDALDNIHDNIINLKKTKNMKDEEIKRLLTFKLKKQKDNKYNIENKISKEKDINDLYNNILKFLNLYLYIKEFDYFSLNQPVDYKDNQSLFYIFCFYKLYENIVIVNYNKDNINIFLNVTKIKIFSLLKEYRIDILNDINNNGGNVNESAERKISFFYFCFKTKFINNLDIIIKRIIKKQTPLTKEDIDNYIHNNNDNDKKLYINSNKLVCEYNNEKYEFEYKNYNSTFLNFLDVKGTDVILKSLKYNNTCLINFFDENDIDFMKYLIKKILKSQLFNELWKKYSKVDKTVEYYFNNDENIEDLFNRIYFYPFNENNFGIQALTYYNDLKIILSGLPVSNISGPEDYNNYKILEISRKIIIILHEVCHFIKRALNLITNSKISCVTIETDNDEPDILEAGRLFEKIVFGWSNDYKKKRKEKSLSKHKDLKNEKDEKNSKILNIQKALKILNSNIYECSIYEFKNKLYDNEDLKMEEFDEELLKYLKGIDFDINDYYENKEVYQPYTIDCSRKSTIPYSITYKGDIHNFKH